jgi:hypothetical protein
VNYLISLIIPLIVFITVKCHQGNFVLYKNNRNKSKKMAIKENGIFKGKVAFVAGG